MFSVIARNTKW